MSKYSFTSFYLLLICLTLTWNTVHFFRDGQIAWAIAGGIFAILYFLSAVGSYKNIKSLLWLGVGCVFLYSLYAIGAVVWTVLTYKVTFFLVLFVAVFCLINIFVIYQIKERLDSITLKNYEKLS